MNHELEPWVICAVLSLAVTVVSMTLSSAVIFENLRVKIGSKSDFLNQLIRCPYCTSFWVALPFVLLFRPILIMSGFYWIDVAISWFCVVGISTWLAGKLY